MSSESLGKVIIVSAPSGAGKTTIVKHLLGSGLMLDFSVSACSRPPRSHEVHGKDYYFMSADVFREKIRQGDFIEWEEVYPGRYYGTLKEEIRRIWDQGHFVLFDVDVKGGMSLKRYFGGQALALFVMPPSVSELEKRLRLRSTDPEESIAERVKKASLELSYANRFDLIIVNDRLETALTEAESAVKGFLQSNMTTE